MNADDARALWTRFLAGEELSPEEQRSLVDALEADPGLRSALLGDLALDGALRGLAGARQSGEAFERAVEDAVAREHDATRFVRKVELALAAPPSKPPSSTKIQAVRDGRALRFTRRLRGSEPNAIAWKVGMAAAALFFALLFLRGSDVGALVLYGATFAIPYLVVTRWRFEAAACARLESA